MVDVSVNDAFLAETLRKISTGERAQWLHASENSAGAIDGERLSRIWSRIDVHGIAVLLHNGAGLLDGWPAQLLERIAEESRLLALWEMTHAKAISHVTAMLADKGIESLMMKGTALAYSLHDDPSARRRGDSDILIRPVDLARTRTILAEAGWYRSDDPHGLTYQEGWLYEAASHFVHALDLHWQPSDRPVIRRVLNADEFFAHKEPLDRLAPNAFRADHALTMIHETINQKWHYVHGYWTEEGKIKEVRRLIWSVDFDLLIRAMEQADWSRLITLCQARGVGRLVAEAMRAASADLGTPLPSDVLTQLDDVPLSPEIAAHFATTDKFGEFWLDLRMARNWGERGKLVSSRAFPPRDHLIKKFSNRSHWPTPLLQVFAIMQNVWRVLKRAAIR